jgi:hypothetical protein
MVAKVETKPATTTAPEVIDTSGWNDANINIDGWYDPEASGKIIGRCLEAISVQTAYGPQDVVKVRLAHDSVAIQGKGDAAEKVPMAKGSVMAVRISTNLTVLLELVQNQCAVEIQPTGKKKTSSGRQILTYKVKWKGDRAPLLNKPQTQELPAGPGGTSAGTDDDPLPF